MSVTITGHVHVFQSILGLFHHNSAFYPRFPPSTYVYVVHFFHARVNECRDSGMTLLINSENDIELQWWLHGGRHPWWWLHPEELHVVRDHGYHHQHRGWVFFPIWDRVNRFDSDGIKNKKKRSNQCERGHI